MNLCIVNVQSSLDHCKLYSKQEVFCPNSTGFAREHKCFAYKSKYPIEVSQGNAKVVKKNTKIYLVDYVYTFTHVVVG